jgi:hypothetical protein
MARGRRTVSSAAGGIPLGARRRGARAPVAPRDARCRTGDGDVVHLDYAVRSIKNPGKPWEKGGVTGRRRGKRAETWFDGKPRKRANPEGESGKAISGPSVGWGNC